MESLFLLFEIIVINIILSGDNAVVIALASRNLPASQQKRAVLLGSAGAVLLRVLFTAIVIWLLAIPYLQFAGGLLLVWIALTLLLEEDAGSGIHSHNTIFAAVKTIIVADIVMSLDNTLAIAAIAKGDYLMLILGLVLSVPLIIFGSQLIITVMERFPVIVYAGAGLIAWTAGEMMAHDPRLGIYLPQLVTTALPAAITVTIIAGGWWYNLRHGRKAADVLLADEHAAARLEDKID